MEYDNDENLYMESEEKDDDDILMQNNPLLLPIHYWSKITEIIYFNNDPDVGTGILYRSNAPFGIGSFIDEYGKLSQVRPVAEGGWKRECYQPEYELIFREYENEHYMYVVNKTLYGFWLHHRT
jgi:hypothetical protein